MYVPSLGRLEGGATGVADDAPQVIRPSTYGADLGTVERSVGGWSEGDGYLEQIGVLLTIVGWMHLNGVPADSGSVS